MKRDILFGSAVASLLLMVTVVSCNIAVTPVYLLKPTGITMKVADKTLTTDAFRVNVILDEDNRYYHCTILPDSLYKTFKDDNVLMQALIDTLYSAYRNLADFFGTWQCSFATKCLRYGNDYVTFSNLKSGTNYVVCSFCVDPDKLKPIGDLYCLNVKTNYFVPSDLSFKVLFQEKSDGPFITVAPSNDMDSYIWDFETIQTMKDKYKDTPKLFIDALIESYRSWDDLESLVVKGFNSLNVSPWFEDAEDTVKYIFVVTGYDGGYTTPIMTDTFCYPFDVDSLSFIQPIWDY